MIQTNSTSSSGRLPWPLSRFLWHCFQTTITLGVCVNLEVRTADQSYIWVCPYPTPWPSSSYSDHHCHLCAHLSRKVMGCREAVLHDARGQKGSERWVRSPGSQSKQEHGWKPCFSCLVSAPSHNTQLSIPFGFWKGRILYFITPLRLITMRCTF